MRMTWKLKDSVYGAFEITGKKTWHCGLILTYLKGGIAGTGDKHLVRYADGDNTATMETNTNHSHTQIGGP